MAAIEIRLGAPVITSDGEKVGKVDKVVFNPEKEALDSIVVRQGMLLRRDVSISLEQVERDGERLRLQMTKAELDQLPDFVEFNYKEPPEGWIAPGALGYFGSPAGVLWPATMYDYQRFPPPRTTAGEMVERARVRDEMNAIVDRGSDVLSRDGKKVGEVAELKFDEATGRITELTVRRGHIMAEESSLPGEWVESYDDHLLTLNVDAESVESSRRR